MTNEGNIEFGVVLQGTYRPAEFQQMAAEIEDLGYSHLWVTDSSLHAYDVYSYLTLAALATSRIKLGTAVTNPLSRHPAITANAINTIAAISNGRAVLGLGAGDRPLEALGFSPASLSQVRRTVGLCRQLLSGDLVSAEDEAFTTHSAQIRRLAEATPPVWLAASGPRMLRLAGEVADGVILLAPLFREAVDYALKRVEAGRRKAQESPDGFGVTAFMYGSMDSDENQAVEEARSIAAWFPQTAPHFCSYGGMDDELVQRIRASYNGGEFQEATAAARLIPRELVRRFALAGNRRHSIEKVEMLIDAGLTSLAIFPLASDRFRMVREFAREVMPQFSAPLGTKR